MPPLIETELRAFIRDGVAQILAGNPSEYQTRLEGSFTEFAILGHDVGLADAMNIVGTTHPNPEIQTFIDQLRQEIRNLRFRAKP